MSGCVYFYHIQRLINAMMTGVYNATVDFNHDGIISWADLQFALLIYGSC